MRLTDVGLDVGIERDREQAEHLLVRSGGRRECHPALPDRGGRTDARDAADGSHRARREAGRVEGADAERGAPEQLLGCALDRLARRLVGDQRGGHDRHPHRDADDGERGAERPAGEAANRERAEPHAAVAA